MPEIEAAVGVSSEAPVAPADAPAEIDEQQNNNHHQPPPPAATFYRMISEDDELAEYLAGEVAEQQQHQPHQPPPIDEYEDNEATATAEDDEVEGKSSASSVLSSGDQRPTEDGGHCVEQLKDRLHHLTERCAQLENRVAQLSLENHRLRGLCDAPTAEHPHFGLTIPRVYVDSSSGRKPFYVYEVRVVSTAAVPMAESTTGTTTTATAMHQRRVEWSVLRRYSEFYELHRKYRRLSGAVKSLEFPPKKHFGNMVSEWGSVKHRYFTLNLIISRGIVCTRFQVGYKI